MKIIFLLFSILLISCAVNYTPENKFSGSNSDASDGVRKPIIWQAEETSDANIIFSVNDKRYLNSSGSSFWKWGRSFTPVLTSFETDCFKVSGNRFGGYGVIFCVQDYDGTNWDKVKGVSFYSVLIRTDGTYRIIKVVNKEQININADYESNDALTKGFNAKNTIKVSYDQSNQTFRIVFNNYDSSSVYFKDEVAPVLSPVGNSGFICSLSAYEDFPSVAVDVRFKQKTPIFSD